MRERQLRLVFCPVKSWGVCLLLVISVWLPGLAQAQSDEWLIHYTSKLGVTDRACYGPDCKAAAERYASQLVRVCINRDQKTSGAAGRGQWVVEVGPEMTGSCRERMYADPDKKLLFVLAHFLNDYGTFVGRAGLVRCEAGWPSKDEFNPCLSEMFKHWEEDRRYKYLDRTLAARVRDDAGVVNAVGHYMLDEPRRRAEEQRRVYLAEFEAAQRSLVAIRGFEEKYAGNDPEGLIARLSVIKRDLLLRDYETRYRYLRTTEDMAKFVADYKDVDPESRVPEVKLRLETEQRRQKEAADAAARDKARADLKAKLTEYEFQIGWCKRRTVAAREVIAREEEIGRISGFVNKKIMREAGEQIVSCSRNNPQLYADYKRLGGVKAYAEIQ